MRRNPDFSGYYPPTVGKVDPFYASALILPFCYESILKQWVCTLPAGHSCSVHVAHDGNGKVLGTTLATPVDPSLRVQEGL